MSQIQSLIKFEMTLILAFDIGIRIGCRIHKASCSNKFSCSLLRWTRTLSPSRCVVAAWPVEPFASRASCDVWYKRSRDLILLDASLRLVLVWAVRICASCSGGRERRRCLDQARQSAFDKQRGHSGRGRTKVQPGFVSQRAISLWSVPRTIRCLSHLHVESGNFGHDH